MQRDLPGLADTTFDLVVVGAGIYGTLAAWEAARRGWRVALVDRGDLGGGTSFNSLKTLHGGLRSLQSANLTQMRRFIHERRAFAIMAPHLVDPLPFCVPTYRHPTRNAWAMRIALAITDVVGRDRHDGIADAHLRLPGGRVVSRGECLRLNPVIADRDVTGGAVWFDYQMRHAERIVVDAAASAAALGAVIGTYVEADGLTLAEGRVAALRVRDTRTDTRFDIRTRAVLNAAGPWAGALAARLAGAASSPAPRLSRAMNLVVPRFTGDHACGGIVDGRYLFMVPWRDVSIVGTSHDPHDGGADAPYGGPAHVAALLRDAQLAFPKAGLGPDTVRLVHRGLLPMTSAPDAPVALLKESAVVDHAAEGCPGLVSLHSVRYTTARPPAVEAVDAAARALGRPVETTPRPAMRLASAGFETVDGLVADARRIEAPGTTPALRDRLARSYGGEWTRLAASIAATPALALPLSETCAVTAAEVRHAVEHEAAVTLNDVLLRRTGAASAGHPGEAAVEAAIGVLTPLLGWTADRAARERAAFERVFPGAD